MNFKVYFSKRKLYRFGLALTGILALLIAIITYYGQYTGNFVISLDEDVYRRGIVLSDTADFLAPSPRLTADPAYEARDITYAWIDVETVKNTDGNFNDPDFEYVAYTFYLKNIGEESTNINVELYIDEVYKGVDKAIRVLVIEDMDTETLYMAPDETLQDYSKYHPEATEFADDIVVFNTDIINFRPEQVKKYSVIIWLEGEDPECIDDILGGKIRLQMHFKALYSDE